VGRLLGKENNMRGAAPKSSAPGKRRKNAGASLPAVIVKGTGERKEKTCGGLMVRNLDGTNGVKKSKRIGKKGSFRRSSAEQGGGNQMDGTHTKGAGYPGGGENHTEKKRVQTV